MIQSGILVPTAEPSTFSISISQKNKSQNSSKRLSERLCEHDSGPTNRRPRRRSNFATTPTTSLISARNSSRILATSWTKQRKSRSKTPLLRCAKRSRAMTTMPLRVRSMTPGQIPRGQFGALQEGLRAGWSPARPLRRSHRWSRRREEGLRCRRRGVRDGRRR